MIVVSTLSEDNYKVYANQTIPSWLEFFPKDTHFFIHCDFQIPINDLRIKYFSSSQEKINFLERNKKIGRKISDKTKGYQTKWDTYCHKVFAQCESAKNLKDETMIFIDADVAVLKPLTTEIIYNFLEDAFCSYVSRTTLGTETGLIFYNLKLDKEKKFFNEFLEIYTSDKLFELSQWDDCFVFDKIRSTSTLSFKSMSTNYEGFVDPISVGPLGEYFDHWMGKLSKVRGYSKHRKFRGKV